MDIFVTYREVKEEGKKPNQVMLAPIGRVDFPVCCVYIVSILPLI